MTEPIFYCYDNEDGIETYDSIGAAENSSDFALNNVETFTEDTDIHHGILIPFVKLTEKNRRNEPEDEEERARWERENWSYAADHTLEGTTADDVRGSIQELDKRGLNTTTNELMEKMGEVVKRLDALQEEAKQEASNSYDEYKEHMRGRAIALMQSIGMIKKALGES